MLAAPFVPSPNTWDAVREPSVISDPVSALGQPALAPETWMQSCDAIDMTRAYLHAHYNVRDLDVAMSFMADDVLWIGPMDCQCCRGAKMMRAILEPEYNDPMCMRDEQWYAHRLGDAWLVSGRYRLALPPNHEANRVTSHFEAAVRQSVTAVWENTPKGWRITYIHASNAFDIPQRGISSLRLGQNAVDYFARVIDGEANAMLNKKLVFFKLTGEIVYLLAAEVRYLTVSRSRTVRVVHEGGEFYMRGGLTDATKDLPSCFVRVHRSCVVNSAHVVSIKRYCVEMDDGAVLPVAEKKFMQVRELLEEEND